MQFVGLLNVAFVVSREYSTVSYPPRQSALSLILFSLGQSCVDQRGLYPSTLSQRVAKVDLTHLHLQVFSFTAPWEESIQRLTRVSDKVELGLYFISMLLEVSAVSQTCFFIACGAWVNPAMLQIDIFQMCQ